MIKEKLEPIAVKYMTDDELRNHKIAKEEKLAEAEHNRKKKEREDA